MGETLITELLRYCKTTYGNDQDYPMLVEGGTVEYRQEQRGGC